MKVFYSDRYTVPLPPGHRFPMQKYRKIRHALLQSATLRPDHLEEPEEPGFAELIKAHDPSFVSAFLEGRLDGRSMRRIGFPWSRELVGRILTTVGGSLSAAFHALDYGIAGNLAGGTHHAGASTGEGFCVFNDVAVACRNLWDAHPGLRIAILDLDVHQGNGNAELLADDERIFIVSVHGEKNYPFERVHSHLDIGLPDGATDEVYIKVVASVLPEVFEFQPDIVMYQAGVDGLKSDTLGRLSLTHGGLKRRDEIVLSECREREIAVSLALGGGYADPIEDTVQAHVGTYRAVRELFG